MSKKLQILSKDKVFQALIILLMWYAQPNRDTRMIIPFILLYEA